MADAFTWSPGAGRFRAPSGRFVTDAAILEHVDAVIQAGQARIGALADRLAAGSLTPSAWRGQTARVLSDLHLTATSLASGGWSQMDTDAQRWAAGRLQGELGHLRDLATGFGQGEVSAAQLQARAAMYGDAASSTFHAARQRERAAAGIEEAKRALGGSAAHCSDCVSHAAAGWRPIADVPPPGTACQCVSRCKCRLLFRRARARAAVEA